MIKTLHLIFKTHLDVGFTDFAENVIAEYFNLYIPAALNLVETLRQRGGNERFIWTTGSWLIYEYLEQATRSEQLKMERAIKLGDIAWHGLPFSTHTELMDADLFRYGLSLSQKLDRRFQRKTIAAKMTDVPGHSRSIIPYMVEAGIQFLHIGVNLASIPPDVPPVFVWRAPDGSEIVVLYSGGGYGGLFTINGLEHALFFAHTGDNCGPPSTEDVVSIFEKTRNQFPNASIDASTLDHFAGKLLTVKQTLPVVTAEIGDTWIHGIGSDPKKVSQFREMLRLRIAWKRRRIPETSFEQFNRYLLLIPEHTWGLDVKTNLFDFTNYAADNFSKDWDRNEGNAPNVSDQFKHSRVCQKKGKTASDAWRPLGKNSGTTYFRPLPTWALTN